MRVLVATVTGIIALLFSAGMLAMDTSIGWAIYKQQQSISWPAVSGVITRSDLKVTRGSKGGRNYAAMIAYTYQVQGRDYSSDRHAFGPFTSSSSQAAATATQSRYPVGARCSVRYNPADVSEATLDVGINEQTLQTVLFALPFNAVMAAMWVFACGGLWRLITKPPVGGLRVSEADGLTLVRVAWWSPVMNALVVVGVGGFASIFIVGIAFGQKLTPQGVGMVLAIVLGLGALVFAVSYMFGPRWDRFIAIDAQAGTLTLPAMGGVKEETTVPLANVYSVQSRSERRGKTTIHYLCVDWGATDRATDRGEIKGREWRVSLASDRLAALVEYLKERTGLMKTL